MKQQHRGHLGKKQRAVINDMFKNGLAEPETLEKHNIRPCRYRKWLENGMFKQEIDTRIEAAMRQSKLVMVRWLPLVAERLAQLTISEKDETARKACLDIISLHTPETEQKTAQNAQTVQAKEIKPLPPEMASKLLAALAEKNQEPQASPWHGLPARENTAKPVPSEQAVSQLQFKDDAVFRSICYNAANQMKRNSQWHIDTETEVKKHSSPKASTNISPRMHRCELMMRL